MSAINLELPLFKRERDDPDVRDLVEMLRRRGWMTRAQIEEETGWSDRTIRGLAEASGDQVVRGPRGFNAFENCDDGEIIKAATISENQAKRMLDYGLKLKRRLHARVGAGFSAPAMG
jgi:hypothetical protein